jgi:hypothetical protein
MHHISLCTICIAHLLVSHACIFAIDPTEQELEEPAQVEETNPEQEQDKPRRI